MQTRFPSGDAAWRERVTRMILDTDVQIKRLWMQLPQIPDPEMGLPFTGPLSPVSFQYPPFDRSGGTGGTNTGGTPVISSGTTGGCQGANYLIATISGITTGGCTSINGVWRFGPLATPGGLCTWSIVGGPINGSTITYITTPRSDITFRVGGVSVLTYRLNSTPPLAGECKTYGLLGGTCSATAPATIQVCGSDDLSGSP